MSWKNIFSFFCEHKDQQTEIILMDIENVSTFIFELSLAAFNSYSFHILPLHIFLTCSLFCWEFCSIREWMGPLYEPTAWLFPAMSSWNRLSNLLCFHVHARICILYTPPILNFSLTFSYHLSNPWNLKTSWSKQIECFFNLFFGGVLLSFFLSLLFLYHTASSVKKEHPRIFMGLHHRKWTNQ